MRKVPLDCLPSFPVVISMTYALPGSFPLARRYFDDLEGSLDVRCTYRWPEPEAKFRLELG
jgi:hypothetical protein